MIDLPKRSGIYGLICPVTNEMRYVGQSSNVSKRVNGELGHSRGLHRGTTEIAKQLPLNKWLVSLHAKSRIPKIIVIEFAEISELDDREIAWISFFRELGCRLLNCSIGGGGVRGFRWTTEMRRRQSKILKGRKLSDESCRQRSETMKKLWNYGGKPPQAKGLQKAQNNRRTVLNEEQEQLFKSIVREFRSAPLSTIQQILRDEGLLLGIAVIKRMRKIHV